MPHYDESFIHDDNLNQKRNKRSYHVYKHGSSPLGLLERGDVLQALEERGTSVIKRNIRNIKERGARTKSAHPAHPAHPARITKGPDIIIDHCPRMNYYDPDQYYDIRNNNVSLVPCKSLDNLTLRQAKKNKDVLRSGTSLQSLVDEERLQHYASPSSGEDQGGSRRGDGRSYYFSELRRRPQRRLSRGFTAPGVGVYRQISTETSATTKTLHDSESSGESGSGHRGSLRGANKLARRARSFKDDLLERISNLRSPQQHAPHLSSALRSHSPLSPKIRNMANKSTTVEEGEVTPAKELERLVKDVTFGLKHFSDVITKRKLEMLTDNGTLVFESIANIHKAIKPYFGRSPQLASAGHQLCLSLATLVRLCDEISAAAARGETDDGAAPLRPAHVAAVVGGVTQAVADVVRLAQQHMTARPALSARPPTAARTTAQRNSLPDIPLTPKEILQITGEGGSEGGGVRASHSSESVLDAPDLPPPKPARPNRKMEPAPPLPPKRKSANDSWNICSIDRLSGSSGSLDSMLNVSNEEENRSATNHDHVFASPHNSDLVGICSCNNAAEGRTSLNSSGYDGHSTNNSTHTHSNHNRFSNESGFVSVADTQLLNTELVSEQSFSSAFASHHYSTHVDSNFDSTDCVTELKSTRHNFESRMNFINANFVSTQHSKNIELGSVTSEENETPPELPAKARTGNRADLQHCFPNVQIRKNLVCQVHGEQRPHTLADQSPRPPPLPLKKKHIMAYMEMFGKQLEQNNATVAHENMYNRHSMHTYKFSSGAGASCQRPPPVQRSLQQSYTVQYFGATPLSGSEDSVSMTTSSGASPVPPEPPVPPALPPKMSKIKPAPRGGDSLPPPSPTPAARPSSYNSNSADEELNYSGHSIIIEPAGPGRFPLDDAEPLAAPTPSPVPSQRSVSSTEQNATPSETNNVAGATETDDIILQTDVSAWLLMNPKKDVHEANHKEGSETNAGKDGPEVRGGHPDALIVLATKATKDFAYQEAFLATYRTWVGPAGLVERLVRRARHFRARPHELRSTLSLLTRVVADLTMTEMEASLLQEIMTFIYWLVEAEELPISKALRQIIVDKQRKLKVLQIEQFTSLSRATLLDFKASEVAEQMTLLDSELFTRITTAEVLSWPRDQSEESSPNLTRYTAHFNNMSYWARSRILEQDEDANKRLKYATMFLKIMKVLRKLNNFNSFLALVSALDSPPVRRLGWPKNIEDQLREHCALIDSSHSFRAYRQALAETHPPCIPYIGIVLQDLTFVNVGSQELLADGRINFVKRWQQYHIMENMKRFQKEQYKFKRNDAIQRMFNNFSDVLSEDAMWDISKAIVPNTARP